MNLSKTSAKIVLKQFLEFPGRIFSKNLRKFSEHSKEIPAGYSAKFQPGISAELLWNFFKFTYFFRKFQLQLPRNFRLFFLNSGWNFHIFSRNLQIEFSRNNLEILKRFLHFPAEFFTKLTRNLKKIFFISN